MFEISISYRPVTTAIWPIFSKFLILPTEMTAKHKKTRKILTILYEVINHLLREEQEHLRIYSTNNYLKVVSTTFVLVYFLKLNESTCQKCLFHFKSSFRSRENQTLKFYIFKVHDVIKCLTIKQEKHFIE